MAILETFLREQQEKKVENLKQIMLLMFYQNIMINRIIECLL